MTKIELVREDEKATAILKAIRQIDDGEELEQVVRCKDCKHCIYNSYACGDVRCGKLHTDYIRENSFCSYGERKDNEEH